MGSLLRALMRASGNCKKIQELLRPEDYNKQMKNILEEINSKLYDTGKWISDRIVEIT